MTVPDDDPEHGPQHGPEHGPVRRALRGVVAVAVLVSVAWAVLHRPSLAAVHHHPARLAFFVGALVVSNVVYGSGLLLCAVTIARHAVGQGRELGLWQQLRRFGSAKRWSDDMLLRASRDPWFRAGFTLNWIGAAAAALVPPAAVLTLLPATTWGLLSISVLDLGSTMVLRLAIRARIRRIEAAVDAMSRGSGVVGPDLEVTIEGRP